MGLLKVAKDKEEEAAVAAEDLVAAVVVQEVVETSVAAEAAAVEEDHEEVEAAVAEHLEVAEDPAVEVDTVAAEAEDQEEEAPSKAVPVHSRTKSSSTNFSCHMPTWQKSFRTVLKLNSCSHLTLHLCIFPDKSTLLLPMPVKIIIIVHSFFTRSPFLDNEYGILGCWNSRASEQ